MFWPKLDEVLRGHCAAVGRDSEEISRSVHQMFDPEVEPKAMVAQANEYFAVGADIVVWSWRGPLDPARLEPLARAIEES